MSQSNAIAGALALAFLVFITLRGELPKYLNLFKPKQRTQASSGSGSDNGSGSGGPLDGLLGRFQSEGENYLLDHMTNSINHYFDRPSTNDGSQIGDGSTTSI